MSKLISIIYAELNNTLYRSNCVVMANAGMSVAYFDGLTPFIDTNNVIARGFETPANDPHYNASGYAAYGYFLWQWMDLQDAQIYGATSPTGTLPTATLPGITTNVSVSGLTFYITNGLIMQVSAP